VDVLGHIFEVMVGMFVSHEPKKEDFAQEEQLGELVKIGYFYRVNNKYEEAVKYFKQALKIRKCSDVYNHLGIAYIKTEEYQKAVSTFHRALDIDRGHFPAFYNMGIAFYHMGKYKLAEGSFAVAVGLDGLEARVKAGACNDRGGALERMYDFERAEASYKASLALNEKHLSAYVNLGNLYCKQDKLDEASVYYNKALELNDRCGSAYNGLGILASYKGDFEMAKKMFDKALVVNKSSEAAHMNNRLLEAIIKSRECEKSHF